MRFSTCSTPISDSMCPNTRSSRSPTGAVSSSSCFSAIFRFRWLAIVSASLVGSSMPFSDTSTSGAIFLFSLIYCSNWPITVRPSASSSLVSPSWSGMPR